MKLHKRNLIVLFLLLFSCSCVSTTNPHELKDSKFKLVLANKPPEFKKFQEVYKRPYEIHKYDCSNKCAEYVSHLMDKGIFAQLLGIDHHGPGKTKYIYIPNFGYAIERHAIVRVFWRNKFLYCDPTNFTWSRDIKDFAPGGYSGILMTVDLEDFSNNPKAYSF